MGDTSNLVLSWRTVMMAMVCLPILICVVILCTKKIEKKASVALACLLFAVVLSVMPQIIGFAYFYRVWPELTFFPFATQLWFGPLLYIHAHLLLKSEALTWRKWLLLPGVLQTTYYTAAFFLLGNYEDKWEFSRNIHSVYVAPFEGVLAIALLGFALYKIWRLYYRYETYIFDTESIAIEFQPVWLKRIIIVVLIGGGLFAAIEISSIFVRLSYTATFPIQVLIIMSVAWLGIEAVWRLNQPFPKLPVHATAVIDEHLSRPKNKTESIDARVADLSAIVLEQAQNINELVSTQHWFLEPRFSLKELAKRMASNEAYISKAINQGLNTSFNHYINGLRVNHAQTLIQSTSLPLLTIALDSGFNSKATFNRVFKDICGVTPSQFKKGLKT
jgi:AraC-like DNA-binding protein